MQALVASEGANKQLIHQMPETEWVAPGLHIPVHTTKREIRWSSVNNNIARPHLSRSAASSLLTTVTTAISSNLPSSSMMSYTHLQNTPSNYLRRRI